MTWANVQKQCKFSVWNTYYLIRIVNYGHMVIIGILYMWSLLVVSTWHEQMYKNNANLVSEMQTIWLGLPHDHYWDLVHDMWPLLLASTWHEQMYKSIASLVSKDDLIKIANYGHVIIYWYLYMYVLHNMHVLM